MLKLLETCQVKTILMTKTFENLENILSNYHTYRPTYTHIHILANYHTYIYIHIYTYTYIHTYTSK